MALQRPVPLNILASQQGKLVQSPTAYKRRSPLAKYTTRFRTLYFSLVAGQSIQISEGWMRGFLLIQNQDMNPLSIEFGRPATVQSYSLGGGGEFRTDSVCPCDSINLYALAGCYGVIIEG